MLSNDLGLLIATQRVNAGDILNVTVKERELTAKILSIRDTFYQPLQQSSIKRKPFVQRGRYLLTMQEYFHPNEIYSYYDVQVKQFKSVGVIGKFVLKFKRLFK